MLRQHRSLDVVAKIHLLRSISIFSLLGIGTYLINTRIVKKSKAISRQPSKASLLCPQMRCLLGFICLSLAFTVIPMGTAGEQFSTVVIDAGHGGKDPGSIYFGLVEKDLTLDLALRIGTLLTDKGISAELIRNDDSFIELADRATIAKKHPNCIFISLHFNAHVNAEISGTETLYWPGSESGQQLASCVQSEFGRRLVARNRGFRPERLKVLEPGDITGILIECGFLSNRWENMRCSTDWYKQILAEEIVAGILRYRESI